MIETYDLSNPDKPVIVKDPQATLDYSQSWAAWLALAQDVIATATVAAESPLVVVGTPQVIAGVVSVMMSGGLLGKTHPVVFTINTTGGRTDQRTIYLRIKDR